MNEAVRIAGLVLAPFLAIGALFYFTRRMKPKRQIYVFVPAIIVGNVWLGFANGWQRSDFVQLGCFLGLCLVMFLDSRTRAQKS